MHRAHPALQFATAAFVAALCAPQARADAPTRLRPPMQADFDRCALAAEELGNHALSGRVRLELLLRASGNVYAAFVRSDEGIDDRRFQRCLTSIAPRWVFPATPVDYQRAYEVSFLHSSAEISSHTHNGEGITGSGRASAFLPAIDDVPRPSALDPRVAQATLEVAEFATAAERAVAEVSVKLFSESVRDARVAVAENPLDPVALRALARALAESRGDLEEARIHAEHVIALLPESEQGHEALLRVCLAQGDDRCALHEFQAARTAADLTPRSRLLAELQPAAQLAAFRLGRKDRAQDPCAGEQGDEAQALCVVKRCLDDGSLVYARELATRDLVPYEAGEWRAQSVGDGRILVTRPIEPVTERAPEAPWLQTRHDARWMVRIGVNLTVQPQNPDARTIMVRHSYCAARARVEEPKRRPGEGPPAERARQGLSRARNDQALVH